MLTVACSETVSISMCEALVNDQERACHKCMILQHCKFLKKVSVVLADDPLPPRVRAPLDAALAQFRRLLILEGVTRLYRVPCDSSQANDPKREIFSKSY